MAEIQLTGVSFGAEACVVESLIQFGRYFNKYISSDG